MASTKIIALIAQEEGFRGKAYLCPTGHWTIGHGLTYYPDTGIKVTKADPPISRERSLQLVAMIVDRIYETIDRHAPGLDQNQKDALTSFVYNLGEGNLLKSTLLKRVKNDPFDPAIRLEFMKWNKGTKVINGKPVKVELPGLTKRRRNEAALYFS